MNLPDPLSTLHPASLYLGSIMVFGFLGGGGEKLIKGPYTAQTYSLFLSYHAFVFHVTV